MDPIFLSLLLAKVILINTRNLIKAVDKAKSNDGTITADEMPDIFFNTVIQTLTDLGAKL